MQWPLEGLLGLGGGRGPARGLPLPHLLRLDTNVIDLLLGAGSTAETASQAGNAHIGKAGPGRCDEEPIFTLFAAVLSAWSWTEVVAGEERVRLA